MKELYKARVSVEVMVMAQNEFDAMAVAKEVVGDEVKEFGEVEAVLMGDINEVPESWRDSIPYSEFNGMQETRSCCQIVGISEPSKVIKEKPKPKEEVMYAPIQKGGVNKRPITPRPEPPKGQGVKRGLSRDSGLRF